MKLKNTLVIFVALLLVVSLVAPVAYSQEGKMGYVDLRRAFYEYDKTKKLEESLTALTEGKQVKRTKDVEAITKMRDEAEMLSGDAKKAKQTEIDNKLAQLQDFDRVTRQELLNKKNDMFRAVIDDIQKIVETIGKKEKYDYILDSRNIMYANDSLDLTEEVLKQLNK